MSIAWPVATGLFGAMVGSCELIGRYRDAPMEALRNIAAFIYIAVNIVAAIAAYALIVRFGWTFGATPPQVPLVQAGVAGFSAMAFFRSSLFNVRVGDTDVAVGPAILFQILTFATDRAVDRKRGATRSTLIGGIMAGVSFNLARDILPNFCFELMQNVPLEERQNLILKTGALASLPPSGMTDSVKAMQLGLMLMNVVGREVLTIAVRSLGERIQGPSSLSLPIIVKLQNVIFEKAFPALVDCCFVMSKYGTEAEQKARKDSVIHDGTLLGQNPAIDNTTKVTMLALSLQQRVGDAVLLSALVQLDTGLDDGSKREQNPKPKSPAVEPMSSAEIPPLTRPTEAPAGTTTTE
jgi:hypothetical protein